MDRRNIVIRFNLFKNRRQRGDTIIEVMLAMVVVGMVLGVSYGIANRSVIVGRDAQERTEALKHAETQLELIKAYVKESSQTNKTPTQIIAKDLNLRPSQGLPSTIDGKCLLSANDKITIAQVSESLTDDQNDCRSGLYQIYVACVSTPPERNFGPIDKQKTCPQDGGAVNDSVLVRVVWEKNGAGLQPDGQPTRDSVELYYRFGS